MTVTPGSILTAQGAAAFAGSAAGEQIVLTHLAFGDANGASYTPTGQETALHHEVVRVAIDAAIHDPAHPEQMIATGTVPATTPTFTIREVGLIDSTGRLLAIAPAAHEKFGPGTSAPTDFTWDFHVAVGGAANVAVSLDGAVLASRDWALLAQDFFAVVSATATAPPGAPGVYDQYLVPAGATGAWAGQAGRIAVWRGATYGWLFVPAPNGAEADAEDTGLKWRRRAGAWALFAATHALPGLSRLATSAEAFAGAVDDAPVTPAGLAAARQTGAHTFGNAAGANALVLNLSPAATAYVAGMPIAFKVAATNTGPVTVNVNGLGPRALVGPAGDPLIASALAAGRVVQAVYDGAAFQLVSPRLDPPPLDFFAFVLGAA